MQLAEPLSLFSYQERLDCGDKRRAWSRTCTEENLQQVLADNDVTLLGPPPDKERGTMLMKGRISFRLSLYPQTNKEGRPLYLVEKLIPPDYESTTH